jgi:uncharacterized protein (DUF39 family)/ferredoxin
MPKSIDQINEKIARGSVRVVRADQMTEIVRDLGPDRAAEDVDVVTTGTFGAMCSSGAWFNFGHSDPPIKMSRVWLNDVELYTGVAAVDGYLGATQPSETEGIRYGGAHVLEDLLRGKPVVLRAVAYGTDCYPRKHILTTLTLDDFNTALLSNPRNGYQRYAAAANSSSRKIQTYMGTLRPGLGNVTYSGAGALSPLSNDPDYRTIGLGTRIFLGGAEGYVTGPGTQHNPESGFGTLMVQGELKQMSSEFLRAASFPGYGCTLYVGLGIPIPILDADLARRTGVADADIATTIYDYSVPSRSRPALKTVTYAELKSGRVEIGTKTVPTSPLSSFALARRVADELKHRIESGAFTLSAPVQTLPKKNVIRPLEQKTMKTTNKAALTNGVSTDKVALTNGVRTDKVASSKKNGVIAINPRANSVEIPQRGLNLDRDRCVQCGHCLSLCPNHVFSRDENWELRFEPSLCRACGLCVEACPLGALAIRKR